MSESNYAPKHRRKNHWMLDNGSIIEEPNVDSTPAGRRMRIAGQETFPRSELGTHLYKWVYGRARARDAYPVMCLPHDPNTEEDSERRAIIFSQVDRFSPSEGFQLFRKNSHSDEANWIFRHPELPIYARVSLAVVLRGQEPYVDCELHMPNLCRGGENFWSYQRRSPVSSSRELTLARHPEFLEDAREILRRNDIEFGAASYPNAEAAMTDAIQRFRAIETLDQLHIPNLRGAFFNTVEGSSISAMVLELESAQQSDGYVNEMQEYAEMLAPADEIVEHWRAITDILKRRGVPVTPPTSKQILDILTGTRDELPVNLKALRREGSHTNQDRNHTVTLDMHGGVVFVSCTERAMDPDKDILSYELAKARAEITGETDLMEAFLAAIGKTRMELERNDIVNAARGPRRHA